MITKKESILILLLILDILYRVYIPDKLAHSQNIKEYEEYINNCKKYKRYNRKKIINSIPYISVCLPAYNMEEYIEKTLLSIINQSFQDFEIIIVNDNSNDNTLDILNRMKLEDQRIKIINHENNKGVYFSRIEAIQNSNSQYIILMDPDDMYLNINLFEELYKLNYNSQSHYHNFSKQIIEQPELSTILFKDPNTNRYRRLICRNIWNKMIRRTIFKEMYEYIGINYYNDYIITADDMAMNIIIYHFANNYSNIDIPGYMYTIRQVSMSRGDGGERLLSLRAINNFYYFDIFYKYIKEFNIQRKSLFYEIRNLKKFLYLIKDLNVKPHENNVKTFLNEILDDSLANKVFKYFANEILLYFEEDIKVDIL